jgi:hypothetical protein
VHRSPAAMYRLSLSQFDMSSRYEVMEEDIKKTKTNLN